MKKKHLTRRELQVLQHLIQDQREKEIAYKLGIAQNTVIVHAGNIYKKTGVHSRVGLLLWALKRDLVEGYGRKA
jgi:two-component system nitrate/nitrite response regulator NarL